MEIDKGSVVVVMCLIADRMRDNQTLSCFLITQYVFQIVPLKEELHFLREPHENHEQQGNYKQARNQNYQYHWKVCAQLHIHAGFISMSVKMEGTSSSVPHRLNNSSWSASLLHIKKQHTTWAFEWAVERKQPVSCQGEHPENYEHFLPGWHAAETNDSRKNKYLKTAYKRWNIISGGAHCTWKTVFWGRGAKRGHLRGCILSYEDFFSIFFSLRLLKSLVHCPGFEHMLSAEVGCTLRVSRC